jgi:hypothetical protein
VPRRTDPDQQPPPPARPRRLRPPPAPRSRSMQPASEEPAAGEVTAPTASPPALESASAPDPLGVSELGPPTGDAAPGPGGTVASPATTADFPAPTILPPAFPQVSSVDELLEGDRFSAEPLGGGVSETWLITDPETGHRFILKHNATDVGDYDSDASYDDWGGEGPSEVFDATNEVVASRFHQAVGHSWPRAQFASPNEDDWSLMHHVDDFPDDGELLVTGAEGLGAGDYQGIGDLAHRLDDPLEPLRILVADYVLDNTDRHSLNWLVMSAGSSGKVKPVPIDHAYTLLGRASSAGHTPDSYLDERLEKAPSLPDYLAGFNAPAAFHQLHHRAVQDQLVERSQARAEYDRLVDRWSAALEEVNLDDIVDPDYRRRVRELVSERIADLRRNRTSYLRFLNGASP